MSADCRLHRHQDHSVQIRAACCRSVSFSSSVHERKPPDLSGDVAFQISWSSWGMETIRTLPFSSPSTVTRCWLSAPKKDLSFHKNKDFQGSTPRNHAVNPHSDIEMRPELFPSGRQRLAVWHRHHFMWRLLLPQPAAAFHVRSSLCQQLCKCPAVEPCSAALS